MFHRTSTASVKHSTLRALNALGVGRAEVEFSGGNDEGGADGIAFFDRTGEPMKLDLPSVHSVQEYERLHEGSDLKVGDYVTQDGDRTEPITHPHGHPSPAPVYRLATTEEIGLSKLRHDLEVPVYERYGSFAGDFEVYGKVIWDVVQGTVGMKGEEDNRHYEPFEDVIA
jgi:hypothetical protein